MCQNNCEHPEKLHGNKPGNCSEAQIRECHGEEALKRRHRCTEDK